MLPIYGQEEPQEDFPRLLLLLAVLVRPDVLVPFPDKPEKLAKFLRSSPLTAWRSFQIAYIGFQEKGPNWKIDQIHPKQERRPSVGYRLND